MWWGIGGGALAIAAIGAFAMLHEPLPTPTRADVSYGHGSGGQVVNLYVPGGAGPFPIVAMIHGGAFAFGNQNDVGPGFKSDVEALNARGIAVASIGYRLSGEAPFPAAVQDVKGAIRFLRRNAATYRLDGARIALWGKSAGANLALMAGLAHGVPAFDNAQIADPAISDRVTAIVSFYAPTDFLAIDAQLAKRGCVAGSGPFGPHNTKDSPESRYMGKALTVDPGWTEQSNPANYVTPDAPPILMEAGGKDCMVGPDQSQVMFDALQARAPGSRARFFILPDAQHADPVFDQGTSLTRVIDFLAARLGAS